MKLPNNLPKSKEIKISSKSSALYKQTRAPLPNISAIFSLTWRTRLEKVPKKVLF